MPGEEQPDGAVFDDPLSLVGAVLEKRYQIEAVVGEGGFGVVYRARHVGFDAPVAIKVLKIPLGIRKEDKERFLDSFHAEGRLLFELGKLHPGFRQVTEMGVIEREHRVVPYLVQEWLDGHTLSVDLERRRAQHLGGRALPEVIALLDPIARALAVAHGHKVAHRDVKPANIFLAQRDGGIVAKLLDLGVAKVMSATGSAALRDPTQQGLAAFTMDYAAPEQWIRKYGATGPWTDVYALALVCVELLTDRRPLEGEDYAQLLGATIDPIRPTPRNRGASVSDAAERLFLAAVAIDPKVRPRCAGEFWDELLKTVETGSARNPPGPALPRTLTHRPATPEPGGRQPEQHAQKGATALASRNALPFATQAAASPAAPPVPTVPAQPAPMLSADGGSYARLGPAAAPAGSRGPARGSSRWLVLIAVFLAMAAAGAITIAGVLMWRGTDGPHGDPVSDVSSRPRSEPTSLDQHTDAVRSPESARAQAIVDAKAPNPLALPCETDVTCGTHKCNRQAGRCAFPCVGAQDCATGMGCMNGLCIPAAAPGVSCATTSCPSDMVCIEGGTLRCPRQPEKTVTAFCLERSEVSAGQYQSCMERNGCPRPPGDVWVPGADQQAWIDNTKRFCNLGAVGRERHPMNCLRLADAASYCQRYGRRLPTDTEWSFAAAGPSGRKYPWGDAAPTAERVNVCDKRCLEVLPGGKSVFDFDDGWPTTAPIDSKSPTGPGLYGLAGNVGEWTSDRSARGGAWHVGSPSHLESCEIKLRTDRQTDPEGAARDSTIGFRCAADLPRAAPGR